jgi:hypothetical protein
MGREAFGLVLAALGALGGVACTSLLGDFTADEKGTSSGGGSTTSAAGGGGAGGAGGGGPACDPGHGDCDGDPGNGCETDVTDTANCGACSARCVDGPCNDGVCDGITELWAGPPGLPMGTELVGNFLVLDGGYIYWTAGTAGNGVVMRVPIGGGNAQTLASDQPAPFGLAVRDNLVYWANRNNLTLMRVGIDGSDPAALFVPTAHTPLTVAVDAGFVYWSERDDPNGGPTSAIFRADKMRPSNDGFILLSGASPFSIAIDQTRIYWTDRNGFVMQASITDGGSRITLDTGIEPYGLAVDGSNVYWTDHSAAAVKQAPKGGGSLIPLGAGQVNPVCVAVDATHVYWTDESTNEVVRVLKGGGSQQVIASGLPSPWGVAVDDSYVYWTTSGNGSVRKRAKPP